MVVYKDRPTTQLVSILFLDRVSQDISHTILDEKDDIFQQLVSGNFQTTRQGKDMFLVITSETELHSIRQITSIPMFLKF